MNPPILLLIPLAYLSGSLPFAVWVTRLVKGVDVRLTGSGHATATNTLRQAGLPAALMVGVLDVTKAFIPAWQAVRLGAPAWLLALVAAAAVAGHCWPVFAQFRGGMGLACTGGSILALSPLAFLIGVGYLILLVLALRHAARASVLFAVTLPMVYAALPALFPLALVWVAAGAGVVLALRFFSDWNRRYRELWLDRPETPS